MLSSSWRFDVDAQETKVAKPNQDIGDWIEAEAGNGGLSVVAWGFGSVVAFVLAFASWQYAPAPSTIGETLRAETARPDPAEITGSIASSEAGETRVEPTRSIGGGRLSPLPLAGDETLATSRDIAQLRSEIRDIQRRIAQIGMSGDGVSRRLDLMEERIGGLAARPVDLPAIAGEPVKPAETAKAADPAQEVHFAERPAEKLPTPQPRPAFDAPAPMIPTVLDADGPATTGAVPKKPAGEATAPAKSEAAPKAAKGAFPSAPTAAAPSPASPQPSGEAAAAPAEAIAAVTTTPAATEAAAAQAPVRVVTGAPNPTATATTPANAHAAAIDLGGFRTLASLRRSWSDLALRHGDLAKGLEPLARLRETDSGMEARLLAGPFADQTEAAKACLRLRAVGATCAVTTYGGQPIAGLR